MTDNGMDRLDALAAAVVLAAEKVETDRVAQEKHREVQEKRLAAADRKATWGRRAAYAAIPIAVVGLFVGGVGWWAAGEAQDAADLAQEAIDTVQTSRAEGIATSCTQANGDRAALNVALLEAYGYDETGQPTQRYLDATDEQRAIAEQRLRRLRPLRLCDTTSTAAYSASGGTEGIVPIDPSDGYSEAVAPPP